MRTVAYPPPPLVFCQPDLAAPFSCDRAHGHPGACRSAAMSATGDHRYIAHDADFCQDGFDGPSGERCDICHKLATPRDV